MRVVPLVLMIIGIFFIGLLIHEGVHVIQSKEPISICYDFQQNTYMHVLHHFDNETQAEEFTSYTEKWAYTIMCIIYISAPLLIGFLIGKRKV